MEERVSKNSVDDLDVALSPPELKDAKSLFWKRYKLSFEPNNIGSYNVTGSGVNVFGSFDIKGILHQDGQRSVSATPTGIDSASIRPAGTRTARLPRHG